MKKLFDNTVLGNMNLKNRFWRSATWENMADEKGHLTNDLLEVYEKLAKGGVGTIITSYSHVMADEFPMVRMMGIYSDDFIAEYKDFTDKIHSLGSKIVMQIVYGGSFTPLPTEGRVIFGPSAVPHPLTQVIPKEMTLEDIETVKKAFIAAAIRVKKSGFDGVQLHGAHSYLLSQFLTPYYNRRTDQYGGPIENRARIIFEILEGIRAEVGPEYPVMIKMHCSDFWDDKGMTVEESTWVAKELEKKGMTAIEFSGGNLDLKANPDAGPMKAKILTPDRQAYFVEETAKIADQLEIPVISVGGHRDPVMMEKILNETKIEYISVCRTLFAEPDLINKWEKDYNVRPRCTSCSKCMGREKNICILDRKAARMK